MCEMEAKCLFCNLEEESIHHLFLHCQYSWKRWAGVMGWWNIQIPITNTVVKWMEVWCESVDGSFRRKLRVSLHYVVLWSIWNTRNRVVFDKANTDWDHESYQIKLRLGFWMKGWATDCPYSPGDLVINLDGVSSWKKVTNQRVKSKWDPPPPRSWKWNVDGSSKGKLGPAGIGGVLRDDKGRVLAKFAAHTGIRDSNEAEILAIVTALELSLETEWLKMGA